MEKKNGKGLKSFFEKVGTSFQNKGFRSGAYAMVTSVLVIVAVVIVNLLATAIDVRKDLTVGGQKSLTKETKELLSGLEDDLKFYFLTKEGQGLSWLDPSFEMYMDLYQRESKKIKVQTVDLLLEPKFAEQYTDGVVIQYSIIVVDEKTNRSKYISSEDMVLTRTTMDMTTFQYVSEVYGLDIEGQINAAIRSVTSGQQTNLYAVVGHGELQLGTEGQNMLRKANIEYNTFEAMTTEKIPEDCDVLYISVPENDYTDAELALFEAYADAGGDFLINAVYRDGMDNFNKLLEKFGVKIGNGVVVEGDSKRHSAGSPLAILPEIRTDHKITSLLGGTKYFPAPYSNMLTLLDTDKEKRSMSTLLFSSEQSYLKNVNNGSVETTKKAGDAEGPFAIGVYVQNNDTKSEAVIVANEYVFMDSYLMIENYVNASFLTNSIQYMSGTETSSTIRTISLGAEEMLVLTASEAYAITITLAVVIPILLIVVGIVIMLRRKNK